MGKVLRIKASTTQTPYNKDTKITPNSYSWQIRNTGTVSLKINGGSEVYPGGEFSVDTTAVLSAAALLASKGVKTAFENRTQYDVVFSTSFNASLPTVNTTSFELVETNYTFELVEE